MNLQFKNIYITDCIPAVIVYKTCTCNSFYLNALYFLYKTAAAIKYHVLISTIKLIHFMTVRVHTFYHSETMYTKHNPLINFRCLVV